MTQKRKHGCLPTNLEINKESLLQEARTWEAGQSINWSQLGTKYGLQTANRGQVIKEFLADQGIEAAQANQRPHRASRRSKKRLGVNISFPIMSPVQKVKETVTERINSGEINIGEEVVRSSYTSYTTNKENEVEKKRMFLQERSPCYTFENG